jgi:spore germination protein GerM
VRTLPADTTLLQFYLLPDGTAIADFSEALSGAMPSGILSEQMAVDSIVRTLEANVSGIQRLKILVRGQEVDTLAGHVDLTGFFPMMPTDQPEAAAANASSASGTPVP